MQGTIKSISVAGMLRLLCSYGRTGVLKVDSGSIIGSIFIKNGEILSVKTEKTLSPATSYREGVIQLLLAVEEGVFYFDETAQPKGDPAGISVEDVIMESSREIFSRYRGKIRIDDMIFPENEVLKTARMTKGRHMLISFEADEWNLLSTFNSDNNISAAIEQSGVEKEKASVILYGLTAAGLVRRTRFKIPEISKIARVEIGNIGSAIVDSEFIKQKTDRRAMGMKNFISLLNGLELSFSEIVGKTRAKQIIEKIWSATK
jgi:hypothetical protein